MILYIDGQRVNFSSEQDVNMTWKFLDTYNPSAIKTSYSKTISLPETPENAAIFSNMKVRHEFELFNDDGGKLLEKGYCTLDRIKSVGIVKTYDITLYGGLGDFFYNLKGDDDNPKTLASLWWGDITGKDQVREDLDPIMTWDNQYVYNTWFSTSFSKIWDTFRAVPCIYDDKILKKDLSIVPAVQDGLFPVTSSDGSGSSFVGSDASEALLVQAEENTCYAKQDFRSDLMPLGIKYRSIIETICKPENNGGYEVILDSDFFNETNPYWTNTFLLKGLPTLDYDYSVKSSSFDNFSSSLIRVGNYQGGGASTSTRVLAPGNPSEFWTITDGGQGIALVPGIELIDDVISYNIVTYVTMNPNPPDLDYSNLAEAWVEPRGTLGVKLEVINLDTNVSKLLKNEVYTSSTKCLPFSSGPGTITNKFKVGNLQGTSNLPPNWTRLKFQVTLTYSDPSKGFKLHYKISRLGHWEVGVYTMSGDYCGPARSTISSELEDSYLVVCPYYLGHSATFEDLKFTKKDLLGGTKTPFDYLVWYTKMFNLRFYLEPGTKRVSIMLPENLIQKFDPENIQDRVCYDKEYSKTRKIIDEGFLRFNLNPNKNTAVEAYEEVNGDTLFDRSFAVPLVEGKGQKAYLDSELKIGSKARHAGNFAVRSLPVGYVYYGFNQMSPYEVTYISGSGVEQTQITDDNSLNYLEGSGRYDFLTLDDGLAETIVMYSGLKELPWPAYSAIISRTSVDMVRFAGAPCWISGWLPRSPGLGGSLLGADFIHVDQIPHYGIVPSLANYDWGLTYSNVDFESLKADGNIYDKYLKTFLENVYNDPMVVECYVRFYNPDFRKLYWFDNAYWILTEISNYNYKDEPVKCKFIRYNYNA